VQHRSDRNAPLTLAGLTAYRTDKNEFYQLFTYRDDVDLEKNLAE